MFTIDENIMSDSTTPLFNRTLAQTIQKTSKSFRALLLTGPRQVGKTTLLELCAGDNRNYITLDDLDARQMAQNDPGLFIQTYNPPLIIDEIQYAPELFSSIKITVDREKKNGLYWLTGSQKFHLMKGLTETLAGRIAIIDLLGLSQAEINGRAESSRPFLPTTEWLAVARANNKNKPLLKEVYQRIWRGSFPQMYERNPPDRDLFYRSYTQTYIQRDIKDVLKIADEMAFHRFLVAVAARTGQMLNLANISRDVGVSSNTVKAWLSALEASGLVYMLYPYSRNIGKRLITSTPKLYFLDTGLCCYLTKWPDGESLEAGAMSGAILETYLFTEILKSYWHNGIEPNFYYYRDKDQKEVDLLIETGDHLYPVEFKKTGTPSKTASKHFRLLGKLDKKIGQGAVICFVEKDIPLSHEVIAIPVSYL